MTEFNYRTALNYRLRQDALTTQNRSHMARQRKEYRHRRAALRRVILTVAVDAAMIGASLAGCIAAVVCAVL